MVIIRQNRTRYLFTSALLINSLVFGGFGISWVIQSGKAYSPGAGALLILIAIGIGMLALRASRASVIVKPNTILVRGFLHSIQMPIDQYAECGIYLNLIHSAWLIGFKSNDGTIVKFPFWSPSWILDSEKNDDFKSSATKIDQTILQFRSGSKVLPTVIDVW